MALIKKIENFISSLDVKTISYERKHELQPLIDYIQLKVNENKPIRLNFICTHNSRRSHMAQIWTQALSFYLGIKNLSCYSGGTEVTALFPTVLEVVQEIGFSIEKLSEKDNPIYSIKYAENELPILGFSKKIDAQFNPRAEFCAIMTCSSAEENCPFVSGAEKRVPVFFDDPKEFDNTPQQDEKYKERNLQIATTMYYTLLKIKG